MTRPSGAGGRGAKNGKENATKCYKLLRFLWMQMDISLPKFDIYQGTGATNCLKSHIKSWCPPHFFQGKILCDVRCEIHLVWRDIVSTRQSVWLKKYHIQAWGNHVNMRKWTVANDVYNWTNFNFRSSYRTAHYVPKCMSCHIVVITGRAHCFHDCIYIYIYIYMYIIYIYIYIQIITVHCFVRKLCRCCLCIFHLFLNDQQIIHNRRTKFQNLRWL